MLHINFFAISYCKVNFAMPLFCLQHLNLAPDPTLLITRNHHSFSTWRLWHKTRFWIVSTSLRTCLFKMPPTRPTRVQATIENFFGLSGSTQKEQNDESRAEQHRRFGISRPLRQFQQSWADKFKWLEFQLNKDKENEKMFCKACKDVGGKGSFVDGCTSFKVSSVKVHNTCLPHVINTRRTEVKRNPEKMAGNKMLVKTNQACFDKLNNLFIMEHGITKNGRPVTEFDLACKMHHNAQQSDNKSLFVWCSFDL